jgi:large subunit ribosomal protein L3
MAVVNMEGLLGKKIGMTQVFFDDGKCLPVTVLKVGPCYVLQKKTEDKDGYNALRLGFSETKENKVSKPLRGLYKKCKVVPLKIEREFAISEEETVKFNPGDVIKIEDIFNEEEYVDVVGTSKGKGFQGAMKRHNFGGGRMTHGSKFKRELGSTGQCATPSRTLPGKKMPGRMGGETVTVQNLLIAKIDKENGLVLVKGAVPGRTGAYVLIKKAVKKSIIKK